MAVTEAQALLQLVAGTLRTSGPLAADEVFTLYVAVTVAIDRLDLVHDVVFAGQNEALMASAPEAVQ